MKSLAQRLRGSFGPFLDTERGFVFDVRDEAPVLGYNASAIFGVCHHLNAWTHSGESVNAASNHRLESAGKIRRYIESEIVKQFDDEVVRIVDSSQQQIDRLQSAFASIKHTVSDGLNYKIQFHDSETAKRFLDNLVGHGLLVEKPDGNCVSFKFNLSYREVWLNEFWTRVRKCLLATDGNIVSAEPVLFETPKSVDANYAFHTEFIRSKLSLPIGSVNAGFRMDDWFANQVDDPTLSILRLNPDSYRKYRNRILEMQSEIYEPARQSPPEEFDALFESANPIGLLILQDDNIVAMSFVGIINLFRRERGVDSDPFVNDPMVFYSLDLTVVPEFRGGLGKVVKRAMSFLAHNLGVHAIHGRNRDRLARGMWAINLSLGAYELQHLVDDYPDDGPNRDCIYYRCPLHWDLTNVDNNCFQDYEANMPFLINGTTET